MIWFRVGCGDQTGGAVVVGAGVGAVEDVGVWVHAHRDGGGAGLWAGREDCAQRGVVEVAGGEDVGFGGAADEREKDRQGVVVAGVAAVER